MPVSGACGRCKARHIKCDELRPACTRCSESRVSCPGYVEERKFLDEGAKLRRKYGSRGVKSSVPTKVREKIDQSLVVSDEDPSTSPELQARQNGDFDRALENNERVPSTPATYVDHLYYQFHQSTGVSPKAGSDPGDLFRYGEGYATLLGQANWVSPSTTPGPSAGSSSLAESTRGVSVLSPEESYQLSSTNGLSSGSTFTQPTSVDQSPAADIEGSVSTRVNSNFTDSYDPSTTPNPALKIPSLEDEIHEISFLLRHFSEVIGPWLDLYDLGHYFTSYIISNHPEIPLLRYAAAAIAAKQLGRVNGRKGVVGGICSRQATMESYAQEEQVDWSYTAAKFYNKALVVLRESFTPDELKETSASTVPNIDENEEVHEKPGSSKRRRVAFNRFSRTRTDRLLAATSILSVYEFLDASNREWSRHLNGIKSLLCEAEVEFMPRQSSQENLLSPSASMAPSSAQVASFWNFARCDYLAAYIHQEPTRLDTTDLPLWRSAGLLIDEQGFVIPTRIHKTFLCRPDEMREDMVSNALVWLISKIINYIAIQLSSTGDPEATDQESAARWSRLDKELDVWHSGLCESFRPSCRLERDPGASDPARALFPELFYSIPLCGASIQHYHFARILLLLYKPQEAFQVGISVGNRMRRYRDISKQIDHHSREICALALGRPPGFVRIHMLQPLYIAGQCLEGTAERKVILDLIRDIEVDTGWATEYRAKELITEWGW